MGNVVMYETPIERGAHPSNTALARKTTYPNILFPVRPNGPPAVPRSPATVPRGGVAALGGVVRVGQRVRAAAGRQLPRAHRGRGGGGRGGAQVQDWVLGQTLAFRAGAVLTL